MAGTESKCGVGVGVVAVSGAEQDESVVCEAVWDGRRSDEADWDCGVGAAVVGGLVAVFGIWGGTGGSKA